jgi:hypothetical protein
MTVHTNHDALLTLAIPAALEEALIDFLLLHPEWASSFSVVDADGMGQGASLLSAMEKVQGRCRRKLVLIVAVEAHLHLLIHALRQEIHNPEVAYWIMPLSAFGRL